MTDCQADFKHAQRLAGMQASKQPGMHGNKGWQGEEQECRQTYRQAGRSTYRQAGRSLGRQK
jgi:hypothetical protein